MTTQTAIALYILAVTAWVVFCAALHNVASKRKREARRVNFQRLHQQFTSARQQTEERPFQTMIKDLTGDIGSKGAHDRQPSQDAYERGRLRGKVN